MELTAEQLWELRNEIVLCSLYISDYENSFGFDAKLLFNFFEGYSDSLEEDMKELEENYNDNNYFKLLPKYDNINNLYDYYSSLEQEVIDSVFVKLKSDEE